MEFTTKNGSICLNGQKIKIKGANFFGCETEVYCFHGLWSVSLSSLLDLLQKNEFNAVRVPFSAEFALGLDSIKCKSINTSANPTLADVTAGQIMDIFVKECAKRGLLVMLDMHRLTGSGAITELWFDNGTYSEENIIKAWKIMASRYKNSPNVFAADLKNEPHGSATWGGNASTDWAAAAERIGKDRKSVV